MQNYIIRYAANADIPMIQKFIDTNWKKDHILAKDRNFFEWQYISDKLDYVLGFDENGKMQGMLGFISYSDGKEKDIATSMWYAAPGCNFLGIKLLLFVMENEKCRTLFSPGINVKSSGGIYRRMNIKTGVMNQWYRLKKQKSYAIAKIVDDSIPEFQNAKTLNLSFYKTMKELEEDFDFSRAVCKEMVPYKSPSYIERRYFAHPSYEYKVFGVKNGEETATAIIVLRVQEYNGLRALRFIDCIGDIRQISFITREIDRLLDEVNAEYIDMYEAGVPEPVLKEAGWTRLDETQNIIPNYFSPYVQRNISIHYCTTDEKIILFRGDGDQDRPN